MFCKLRCYLSRRTTPTTLNSRKINSGKKPLEVPIFFYWSLFSPPPFFLLLLFLFEFCKSPISYNPSVWLLEHSLSLSLLLLRMYYLCGGGFLLLSIRVSGGNSPVPLKKGRFPSPQILPIPKPSRNRNIISLPLSVILLCSVFKIATFL